MQHVWKLLFGLVFLVALYVTMEKRSADKARRLRAQQLGRFLDKSDFEVKIPPNLVQENFFKALGLLHACTKPEKSGLFTSNESKTVEWYLNEALPPDKFGELERRLLVDSVEEALADCETAGVFDDAGNLAGLEDGRAPTLIKGPFAGERCRVGYRVTPVAAIGVHNHPANFKLLPATVWALQPDRLDPQAMDAARDFRDAKLLDPTAMRRIEETWKAAQKNN